MSYRSVYTNNHLIMIMMLYIQSICFITIVDCHHNISILCHWYIVICIYVYIVRTNIHFDKESGVSIVKYHITHTSVI